MTHPTVAAQRCRKDKSREGRWLPCGLRREAYHLISSYKPASAHELKCESLLTVQVRHKQVNIFPMHALNDNFLFVSAVLKL